MSDDRVQQVIDELDPTPAHEAAWPVSRRQTLRALAAAGLLGAGSGSASGESAGTVIADEASFSNYGSEDVSDGWELTIDDDVFGLTESEETIELPDGGLGEEVVLPNGAEASEMIAPDGTVVWEIAIPDDQGYLYNEGDLEGFWQERIDSGNGDLRTEENALVAEVFDNPDGGAEYIWITTDAVDLEPYSTVRIDWEFIGDDVGFALFGAISEQDGGLFSGDNIDENDSFSRRTNDLDISDVDENRFVYFAADDSSGDNSTDGLVRTFSVQLVE